MQVAIISDLKTRELESLRNAFLKRGFEAAPFIKMSKVGLYTDAGSTRIVVGTINFKKYGAVFLNAQPEMTQFVEPFLDELAETGIYCQAKPESYYSASNKPLMYVTLNLRKIPISKTVVIGSTLAAEQAAKGFSYPMLFKTFMGQSKTQQLVIDSERGLKSAAKSIKRNIDAVVLQEYLEDDLDYCFVVGKQVSAVRRKWDAKKQEHSKRASSFAIADEEKEIAVKAASALGLDIATVKIISGKVINVLPTIDFERFLRAVGSELQQRIAEHYWEALNK